MQPYLVVSTCVVAFLAVYAIVYGVAVIQALPGEGAERVRGYISPGEVVALVIAVLLLLIGNYVTP